MADAPPPLHAEPLLPPPPPGPRNDNFFLGCLMGCGGLIGGLIISFIMAMMADGKTSDYLFMSWGATQWVITLPLILRQRSTNHKNRMWGLIVSGCAGILLCTACAQMIGHMDFR